MKRILFLVLCIHLFQPQAYGAIEIYAKGHKYDSIEAYQESKRVAAEQLAPTKASLNSQQEDYVRQEAQKLGMDVDFSKVKTFQVNQKNISDLTRHKLYVMSVENGVVGALQDFYYTRGQSGFQMDRRSSSKQLQEAIQEAVTASKEPKLLISEPGKVRIMALTTEETDK